MNHQDALSRRLHQALRGQSYPLIEGERHVLYRCPVCDLPWLVRGKRQILQLPEEELLRLAALLSANLANLPLLTCRACSTRISGGQLEVDEYTDALGEVRGYGFSWEAIRPPAHYLVCALDAAWASGRHSQDALAAAQHVISSLDLYVEVLRWLVAISPPAHYLAYPPEMEAALSATNPPGAHAPGTEGWSWQGALWMAFCPPLGADALLSLHQAGPPARGLALPQSLRRWQEIMRRAQAPAFHRPEEGAAPPDEQG